MQYQVHNRSSAEFEIQGTIPFADVATLFPEAARTIAEERDIPGFRRGKAPFDVVKRVVGEQALLEQSAERAVRAAYQQIFRELREKGTMSDERSPIGKPDVRITKLALGDDIEFKATLTLLPEVKLPDYRAIAHRVYQGKQEITVGEEEVEESIAWILDGRATLITVDRPAMGGDAVEVDFSVRHEGIKIEHGESRNHPFILGKGRFLPGFEEAIVGMKTGETKRITLRASEDWHEKQFAGRVVDIDVAMKLVQERHVPELTDAFVQQLGKFNSIEGLKTSIREGLTQEKAEKEASRIRSQIIEAIANNSTMDVPGLLVDDQLDDMLRDYRTQIESMGMKWEDYLSHIKKTIEEMRNDWREGALRRVKSSLALREIAKREKFEPTDEEIKEYAAMYLNGYRSQEHASSAIDPEELYAYSKGALQNKKVFEFLEQC